MNNIIAVASRHWRQLKTFVYLVGRRYVGDRCTRHAAGLSFTTLLALVPLTAVMVSSLSMFPVFESWSKELEEFIYRNFVPTAGDVIQHHLQQFSEQAGKLTAVGLIFVLVTALMLLVSIEESFNDIWQVDRGRPIGQRVLSYWAMLTLGPLLLGGSLSLTSYVVSLAGQTNGIVIYPVKHFVLVWLPVVLEALAFTLLYLILPNCTVKLRHALIGGAIAAILFEITKGGFTWFVVNVASYEVVYGTLATIPIFLIWIYLSWLVVLIGAVVVALLPDRDKVTIAELAD